MELQHLRGNTYALMRDSTGVGLYSFDDGSCLLIDSGPSATRAGEILKILNELGWNLWGIFNTHAHADHCGGNQRLQRDSRCQILASEIEAAFINNPILTPFHLYSAYPLRLLTGKYLMPAPSQVSRIISPGIQEIHGTEFEILDLAGHSLGQLGIATPDNVLFLGDSIISEKELRLNPFLYIADLESQLNTIKSLREACASRACYLSHGGLSQDVDGLVEENYRVLMDILRQLELILEIPRGREEIVRKLMEYEGLQLNRNHYIRLFSSVSAFLSHMCNSGLALSYTEDNLLKFVLKKR